MTQPAKSILTSEVKVGMLFFIGMGLALWFTFFVTGIGTAKGDLAVRFKKVQQLKDGDAVTFNGVRVGTVSSVMPDVSDGAAAVRVHFMIEKKYRDVVVVDRSSVFRIVLGTLGGATLDIRSAGGQPITAEALSNVWGHEGAGLSEAVESVQGLIDDNRVAVNQAITAFGQAWSHGFTGSPSYRFAENIVDLPDQEMHDHGCGRLLALERQADGSGQIAIDLSDLTTPLATEERSAYERMTDTRHADAFATPAVPSSRASAAWAPPRRPLRAAA